MTHTAIGIFQGGADWNISVQVEGFVTRLEAERYANSFHIRLMGGRLYRDHGDSDASEEWMEVPDADVSLFRLKPAARNRIAQAHRKYNEDGLDHVAIALKSIADFDETGNSDLVVSDDDFEPVKLPIARWHHEMGLTCGFGSLAYSVE